MEPVGDDTNVIIGLDNDGMFLELRRDEDADANPARSVRVKLLPTEAFYVSDALNRMAEDVTETGVPANAKT